MGLATLAWIGLATTAAAQPLVVSPEGPFRSVSDAVAAADAGDEIEIRAGVYAEPTITIDRAITITGEAGAILDGQGQNQIILVKADDVTIRGLTLRNVETSFVSDRAALKVDEARRCVIEGNRIEDTFFGIYLAQTAECTVRGNEITGSADREARAGNGIHLWYSRWIIIEDNVVTGHRDGIYLEFVEDSEVRRNVSQGNLRYGLHYMFSDRCSYHENILRQNLAGVAVMYSNNVEMIGNRFEHNWGAASYGLLLKDINDSAVRRNVFLRNTVGILVEGSNRTAVMENEFSGNGWAIRLMANAEDNLFERNNFIGNSFDVSTNSRETYSSFAENYWDGYRGYDLDRDGFGDVPFRPVRLFSLVVERNRPALVLMRSFFVDILDAAERVLPALTPASLIDERPRMRPREIAFPSFADRRP